MAGSVPRARWPSGASGKSRARNQGLESVFRAACPYGPSSTSLGAILVAGHRALQFSVHSGRCLIPGRGPHSTGLRWKQLIDATTCIRTVQEQAPARYSTRSDWRKNGGFHALLVGHGPGTVVIRWYIYRHASRGSGRSSLWIAVLAITRAPCR